MASRFLRFYYYLTPLFYLFYWYTGHPVRVSNVFGDGVTHLYYIFCLACAALCFFVPRSTNLVALIESSVNFLLLLTPVLLASILVIDNPAGFRFGLPQVVNFLLVGSILIYIIKRSERNLFRKKNQSGPDNKIH